MKACFRNFLVILLLLLSGCVSNNSTVNLDPNFLKQEYISLSDEYFAIEKYEKSLELLLKANAINSDNSLDFKIARTAALAKDWALSLEYYNNLLEKDPNNLTIKKSLAWVTAQSGDLESALKLYESLYNEASYDTEIVKNYMLVSLALDNTELAQTILDEFAVINTDEKILEELSSLMQ